jgi:dienelactone hydrolase
MHQLVSWILVTAALICALLAAPGIASAADEISFQTDDGVTIKANLFLPKGAKPVPAVLLLHQLGSSKSAWNAFAEKLTKNSYAVLALDLRGHGGSTDFSGKERDYKSFTDADYAAVIRDVEAAAKYLKSRKDINGGRLAVVGASIGANLAFQYAAEDKTVRTVIMLSPGLNYRGLEVLPYTTGFSTRALFLITSEGDKYSCESCQKLKQAATLASPIKLKVYAGTMHGTDLLLAQEGLDEIMIAWLLNHLVNS